jgi:predicted CoA-binding protein
MNGKNKKTLVLGGSENPGRYSNMAIRLLRKNGIEVVSVGTKMGQVLDVRNYEYS